MLLLLLVCLMKLVDISMINRPRRNGGAGGGASKENRVQNGQCQPPLSLNQHHQQQRLRDQHFHHQQQQNHQPKSEKQYLLPDEYEKLLRYYYQQKHNYQLEVLRRHLLLQKKQNQQSQQHQQQQLNDLQHSKKVLRQNLRNVGGHHQPSLVANSAAKTAAMAAQHHQRLVQQRLDHYQPSVQHDLWQQHSLLQQQQHNCCGLDNCGKGAKPLRRGGMTEHPSKQNHQKSRLPQLNHNSPRHHSHLQQQQQYQLQQLQPNQQQPQAQKRPLTTSPNNTYNNYYGYPNFPYQYSYQPPHLPNNLDIGLSYNGGGSSSSAVSSSRSSYNDDDGGELTDESLKRNVEIVLKNLNRYSNVLQSIRLPNSEPRGIGGGVGDSSSESLSYSFSDLSPASNHNNLNNNNNYNFANMANILSSPESDYNSNPPHLSPFGGGHLNCSIASSHDFTHDNSDYQWFLDYGYRDGGVQHQSILSSLSASYNGIGELSYYEDLAKNIDANLAEVDMESFRAEDIHSLLTHIPSFCKDKRRRQTDSEIDNSICKSELLFSPVKESHISVDSLDLDSLMIDDDIIITCKGNKDNYTIAFEESAMYSDESFYAEIGDPHSKLKQNCINLHSNLDDIVKRKSLEVSMSRSDHAFTTWSKLKKNSTSQLQRYPSGNNNTSVNIITRHAPHCAVRKSSSLPNLQLKKDSCHQLNAFQAVSTSTVDSFKSRNLLPMCQMPISSTSIGESPLHHDSSSNIQSTESSKSNTSTSAKPQHQPAFNLVKLFIKQKSGSSDTCMDVSSGCWPSDASSSSEMRTRKKSMNDSGKGSALSRHDEEDLNEAADSSYQLDSLDICEQNRKNKEGTEVESTGSTATSTPKKVRNDLYREVFDSPAHRNHNKECNLNIRNQPLKNPQVYNLSVQNNNNNSMERDSLSRDFTNKSISDASRTSENVTQIYNLSHSRMKIPVDTITRSMQTSALTKDKFKLVPPSFLAQLKKLGEEKTSPIYVIYPNYALPDLDFVKSNLNVVLSPLNYKEAISGKKPRPTSITKCEEEALSNIDYDQVQDWKSLATLLPVEYRKHLKHIPEADLSLDPTVSQKPLFCMTPPLRRNAKANSCDCASYFQQTTCTSSSGSSQQPSSGYRGSSTMLTDSEFETAVAIGSAEHMKNMCPNQCDSKLDGEVVERPPPSGRSKRGILRRNASANRAKRNSMFEDNCTSSNVKTLEKRRSLQEHYYLAEENNIIQDYLAELEEDSKVKQYYAELQAKLRQQTHIEEDMESNGHFERTLRKEDDIEARTRAENFLSNVPKAELKYYAEIANILEFANSSVPYDSAKLKNEVSRALSQKKVSFTQGSPDMNYLHTGLPQKFSTPPNSPNISMAALRVNNSNQRLNEQRKDLSNVTAATTGDVEKQKQDKISSNRFKRLQIQWELLSKDSSVLLKDLARENETKSGGSTPTSSGGSHRSRIPRPVSYPASKPNPDQAAPKALASPSRIVPPKKYSIPAIPTAVAQATATTAGRTTTNTTTPRPRTPSRPQTTPKRRIPSPKAATRTR